MVRYAFISFWSNIILKVFVNVLLDKGNIEMDRNGVKRIALHNVRELHSIH